MNDSYNGGYLPYITFILLLFIFSASFTMVNKVTKVSKKLEVMEQKMEQINVKQISLRAE